MEIIEPLSFKHQAFLNEKWKVLFENHNLFFSEYSFANNYLFRNSHNYHFIEDGITFVRGEFSKNNFYYIPTSTVETLDLSNLSDLLRDNGCLYPLPETWLKYFPETKFQFLNEDADSDYIYNEKKLATLSGRKLSSRRNLLHQLEEHYLLESKEIKQDLKKDALNIVEQWQKTSENSKDKTDYYESLDAIENIDKLNLFGRIAYADGAPIGFTIGELLTPKIAVIHFAKSLHEIKGVTPFLYKDFASSLQESVEWINMEQDLGIHSLRQAKIAYQPDQILSKWRVYNRN